MSKQENFNFDDEQPAESRKAAPVNGKAAPPESPAGKAGDPTATRSGGALAGHYRTWFLDYASYVILDRAVPYIEDGLKPVQRRILHAMKDLDDGRYNKVANIVGHTMRYHPHGDASISAALVGMGQKDLLIDTQGNWGNVLTGDGAAAPRYIEARLSKFALEVVFNPKTTIWQASYDGRGREPVNLPVKFPLVLSEGVDGIAVGLSCKILPHNFVELLDASIAVLKEKPFTLYPDFLTGGSADFSNYNEGLRGGKVRLRAKIEKRTKYVLAITEIPYGTTTTSLIDSIIAANNKNKVKVKQVVDNTAADVEILVHLPPGSDADATIDALYVFTDCQTTISPNACVILEGKPNFMGVSEILKLCTQNTAQLLKRELEIRLAELEEKWHFDSLERIFIEKRIYRRIEECETWEAVLDEIKKGLNPYRKLFKRAITDDDIVRLTEIKIKRISKYNSFQANEVIKGLEKEMEEVRYDLGHLTEFAIYYFKSLKERYGKGRERRTRIDEFETIAASSAALPTEKLYVNREEGFIGMAMKRDEFIGECSALDDVICFFADGGFRVSRVAEKVFMGKNIIHVALFNKEDPTVYNLIYLDGKSGASLAKRFQVNGVTRDKVYDLTKGAKGSKVHFFSAHATEEAEIVEVRLSGRCKARIKEFEFDFNSLAIKGRGSNGNTLTKYPIRTVVIKKRASATVSG